MEHSSFFLLLIFPRLKSKRTLSEAKKLLKQTKNTPFQARSGNEPLGWLEGNQKSEKQLLKGKLNKTIKRMQNTAVIK